MAHTSSWLSIRILIALALLIAVGAQAGTYQVTRLNNSLPIISAHHFEAAGAAVFEGANINGPSVIRVPDWIPPEHRASPQARYYLYFGHHKGAYIRMAWAETLEGPWQLYNVGPEIPDGRRGVLDMGNNRELLLASHLQVISHMASPDVHIDSANKRIVMYFHGAARLGKKKLSSQRTFVATSQWGLDFSSGVEPVTLSPSYLRVFEYGGKLQGFAFANLFAARDNDKPWSVPENFDLRDSLWLRRPVQFLSFSGLRSANGELFAPGDTRIRHVGLYRSGSTLEIFFTMKEHSPERIFLTRVNLDTECLPCTHSGEVPQEVLRAAEPWEGGALPAAPSKAGMSQTFANALRDPYPFLDEGNLYLFYVGGGESAIGLARLTPVN